MTREINSSEPVVLLLPNPLEVIRMAPANWGWNEYYEEYTCYDCNYSFEDRDDLDDHLDYHHFACLCA